MSRQIRPAAILIAVLGIALPTLATAWTPYGYGPYGPSQHPGFPEAPPYPQRGPGSYEPPHPPPTYAPNAYSSGMDRPYDAAVPQTADGTPSAAPAPSTRGYHPGSGARMGGPWGPRGAGGHDFRPPSGFQLAPEVSDDAYILTIDLNEVGPEQIQVRTQGQWIIISRERTEQQIQKDSFEDGRGYTRSFSYSSGTASRRLSVPRDGDLSAMSREDGKDSIRISIPRTHR